MKNYPEILRSIGGYFDEAAQREISCNEVADHIEKLETELARINRVAACGTVDSFLKLSDDDKRKWFVMAIKESERRKKAEEELAALRKQQGKPVKWMYQSKIDDKCELRHWRRKPEPHEIEIPLDREAAPEYKGDK